MKKWFYRLGLLFLTLTMMVSCSFAENILGKITGETHGVESVKESEQTTTEIPVQTSQTAKEDVTTTPVVTDEITTDSVTSARPTPILPTPEKPVKVACVGDSLTYGNGHTDSAYPLVLQELLGEGWIVGNFGAGGRTATEGLSDSVRPDRSYEDTQEYRNSIAMEADIVIICLGTNDIYMSDMDSQEGKDGYINGMKNLIADYRAANAQRVYICKPPYATASKINRIGELIIPLVEQIALECDVEIIDFYTPIRQNTSLIDTDMTHLTANGYKTMAGIVYDVLKP